jgi:hypothetical protein
MFAISSTFFVFYPIAALIQAHRDGEEGGGCMESINSCIFGDDE